MIAILAKITLLIGSFFFTPPAFANELILPKPTGAYAVGTKAIEIHDATRTMFRNTNPRRWMVQAFYPSQKHEGTYPYMPGTLDDGTVSGVKVLSCAKPNGNPIRTQKFPLVIFVPGLGEERQKYTILCEELASQGYVVLSLDEPYISNFVKYPDSTTIVLTLKDAWKVPRDRNYRYQYYDDAMAGAIKDITYMMTHLNYIDTGTFEGIIDKERIMLMGHSFGGNVAHTLGFQDKRIKVIVDIDSKITDRKVFGCIGVPPNPQSKPVLFIRGMMQYQDDVGDKLTTINNASIWSPNVQHSAFSDQAYLSAKIPGVRNHGVIYETFNWFFRIGPHFSPIDTSLGGKDVNTWFAEYRASIVNWLRLRS